MIQFITILFLILRLAHLTRDTRCIVNLLSFNEFEGVPFERVSREGLLDFKNKLEEVSEWAYFLIHLLTTFYITASL